MKKLVELNRKGFTLIEVIVVAAIIAILAGILVPMIFNQIDESKKSRALADCKSFITAATAFSASLNTANLPVAKNPIYYNPADCSQIVSFLYSDGKPVDGTAVTPWDIGASDSTFMTAMKATAGNACYNNKSDINALPSQPADPWGNAYMANTAAFGTPGAPVWVISAGPNGVLDTSSTSSILNDAPKSGVAGSGDDIGIRWQ